MALLSDTRSNEFILAIVFLSIQAGIPAGLMHASTALDSEAVWSQASTCGLLFELLCSLLETQIDYSGGSQIFQRPSSNESPVGIRTVSDKVCFACAKTAGDPELHRECQRLYTGSKEALRT